MGGGALRLAAERIAGVVDVCVVGVVAGVVAGLAVEPIVHAGHPGVFAHGSLATFVTWSVMESSGTWPARVSVDDRRQCGRRRKNLGAVGSVRHEANFGDAQVLAQALVIGEEEGLVLFDGSADVGGELIEREIG